MTAAENQQTVEALGLCDRITEAFDSRDSILHAELLSDLAAHARERSRAYEHAASLTDEQILRATTAEADRDHWREQERLAVYDAARLARRVAELEAALRDAGEALRAAHDPERWGDFLAAQVDDLLARIDALAGDGADEELAPADETGVYPSGRHISVFDKEDGGGA